MPPEELDPLATANALNAEAVQRMRDGDLSGAIAIARQVLVIVESAFGGDHPHVAAALSNLVGLHQAQGVPAPAVPLAERALRILEMTLGDDHPDVATALNNLAGLHHEQAGYATAVPLYERSLQIREHVFGPDHLAVAVTLNNLASLHQERGEYARAAPLFERALRINEATLGPDHPDVATSLNNLAMLYHDQGAYTRAERLYERALRIREQQLGDSDVDVAASLSNLGALCRDRGMYARAEALHERALRIREQRLGSEHVAVAESLNNLAGALKDQGAYSRAEILLQRALAIWERAFGVDHPRTAPALNNLAGLYREQGAHDRAGLLYERALQIWTRSLGDDHSNVATALNNLAGLRHAMGADREAVTLYERALQIDEQAFGTSHPAIARSLNNLAGIHQDRGAREQARSLYDRALHIHEQLLGPQHPAVATSLSNLAGLYLDGGARDQAMTLAERALAIWEHALGADHPEIAKALTNTALLFWGSREHTRVIDYLARAASIRERYLATTLNLLSEPRKRELLRTQRDEADLLASFHAQRAPDDTRALELAITAALRRKGRILAEVAGDHAALRRNLSPALQAELDTLQARRSELAVRREAADPRHDEAVQALARDVARREDELSRQSTQFRAHSAPLTIEAVCAALPDGAALIEFVQYRSFDVDRWPEPWGESRYVAYVLSRGTAPRCVPLGSAAAVDEAVAVATAALTHREREASAALRALGDLVFAPVRRALGSTEHVVIAPDGALHAVPFSALIDEDGSYVLEHLLVTYVTSGRDLVRWSDAEAARSRPLVLAAPDYQNRYPRLAGALAEANKVQEVFPEVELHVDTAATKDRLLAAQGPWFVHAATHGVFRESWVRAPRQTARALRTTRDIVDVPRPLVRLDDRGDVEDALDDAVLAFAGANDAEANLTAREIAGIDLRGTQLVVLSACHTGVGQIARSEGVYGLRRAVVVAGAESQVVTLWTVDDVATSQLMESYYTELRSGAGRSAALRAAQRTLLGRAPYAHPYFWAAFTLIGNAAPLRPMQAATLHDAPPA